MFPAISACVLNTSYVQIVKELLWDKAWRQENVVENKKRKRSRFVDMIAETFLLSYYISDYKITFICNCWLIVQMAALILVIESLEQMSVVKNRSTFLKITVAKICKWENEKVTNIWYMTWSSDYNISHSLDEGNMSSLWYFQVCNQEKILP